MNAAPPVVAKSRKRTKAGRYTSDITLADLQRNFHLPTDKACAELGVGLTILKRLCRRYGLARWPYRKHCKLRRLASERGEDPELVIASADLVPSLAAYSSHSTPPATPPSPGGSLNLLLHAIDCEEAGLSRPSSRGSDAGSVPGQAGEARSLGAEHKRGRAMETVDGVEEAGSDLEPVRKAARLAPPEPGLSLPTPFQAAPSPWKGVPHPSSAFRAFSAALAHPALAPRGACALPHKQAPASAKTSPRKSRARGDEEGSPRAIKTPSAAPPALGARAPLTPRASRASPPPASAGSLDSLRSLASLSSLNSLASRSGSLASVGPGGAALATPAPVPPPRWEPTFDVHELLSAQCLLSSVGALQGREALLWGAAVGVRPEAALLFAGVGDAVGRSETLLFGRPAEGGAEPPAKLALAPVPLRARPRAV